MATRRDFFRQAATLAGCSRMASALLASIERAAAIDPAEDSSFFDAEHVVILMQENRSFDHMFGKLRGVRGFDDPRAITLPNGKPVWQQSNRAGQTYAPFHLDLKNTRVTWMGSLPHSWRDQTDARNHGNHDGWLEAKKSHAREAAGLPLTLGYYDRDDLPFYYALADAFTICDQNFCSSLTATTPNRLHLWTGTIREFPDVSVPPNVRNADVDYGSTKRWKTFPERLEEAGVSWRVYQNEVSAASGLEGESDAWLANFTDNPLEWFEQYRVDLHEKHRSYMERLSAMPPEQMTKRAREILSAFGAERTRAAARASERQRSLHEKAFTTNVGDPEYRELTVMRYRENGQAREMAVPKGDPFYRFRKDVSDGTLPTVSWIVPSERLSDHPSSAWYGAWCVSEILNILTRNPHVWRKTIFILTYDENDGYFDHVPPFVAPDPANPESGKTSAGLDPAPEYLPLEQDLKRHNAEDARGGPIGLGFRVPLIVASPWSRGGFVCSQVFDHTSVVRLLERVAGRRAAREIRESNISAWRRSVCGDLSSAFRPFDSSAPKLKFLARDAFFSEIHQAQFRNVPQFTSVKARQEAGARPSAALPYELSVDGDLSEDRRKFELTLRAGKSAGAPFHAYTPGMYRGGTKLRTRAYAVAAGDRISDSWDLDGFEKGGYHLRVCGPNGFFREFIGNVDDPGVKIACEYMTSGGIRMEIASTGKAEIALRIVDEAYGGARRSLELRAGEKSSLTLDFSASHGWYDFTMSIEGLPGFHRRFAGRVETGKDSFSDPAIGRA